MSVTTGSLGTAHVPATNPSLHGLDRVNFFLAAMLAGFGPYVAAYLASQNWPQAEIGLVLISALIIVPQIIVALMAPWVGRRAQDWGRRPLLLIGFAALPIRALGFALLSDPLLLLAVQALDGISATVLGVLTALIIADLTGGTGRFNLAQGIVGTASGIGASISTTLSGLVAERVGPSAAFLCIAATASFGTLMIWFLMPETKPPTERTETDSQSVGRAYVERHLFPNGAQHGVQDSSRSTPDIDTSGSDDTD